MGTRKQIAAEKGGVRDVDNIVEGTRGAIAIIAPRPSFTHTPTLLG